MTRNQIKTINIVASNIKSGGALELLSYLLHYLNKNYSKVKVIVYIDKSIDMNSFNNIEIIHQFSVVEKITLFKKSLENTIYFGNLPPLVKTKNSIVYFHNSYLLMNFKELLSQKTSLFVKYSLQKIYIKLFINNVNDVACQTENIKQLFDENYNFHNIKLLPFFQICKSSERTIRKYDFCYISLAHPHKNHVNLFNAMEILANKGISVSMVVTIEKEKNELIKLIDEINSIGSVQISNLGIIPKEEVCNVYKSSRCLCFPSYEETFGLPLIEASMLELDVIASDLPYVYQVVKPSLVFDPDSPEDIADKIETYLLKKSIKSECLVENRIDDLIQSIL